MNIGIIMDGNRRFAKSKGFPRIYGHTLGLKNLYSIVKYSTLSEKIKSLTVYALSTENVAKRSKEEVESIFGLMVEGVKKYKNSLAKQGVKVNVLGDYKSLPKKCIDSLEEIMEYTKNGSNLIFQICLNYGGRNEIIRSINSAIASGVKEFTGDVLSNYLDSAIEPDLIIRTGGDHRISNFLTWQGVYSEYYFTDKFWPQFDESELQKAILSFEGRERRFGK